jgi:hypothetical protein
MQLNLPINLSLFHTVSKNGRKTQGDLNHSFLTLFVNFLTILKFYLIFLDVPLSKLLFYKHYYSIQFHKIFNYN